MRSLILSCLLYTIPCFGAEMDAEIFFKKYSSPIYQDIIIHNQVVSSGTDLCAPRYDLIKPILDLYRRPFTVLDLGAAQGYFSFSIAHDYPHSSCVMIDANTSFYSYSRHGDMLYDLCLLNRHLDNICYLNKSITLPDLIFLNRNEHFDVVFALLVVHLMYDNLNTQKKVIEQLLRLGDNVILEVANDVDVVLTAYVESLSKRIECQYLGEVRRHKNPDSFSTGKLFWFKMRTSELDIDYIRKDRMIGLKKHTFLQLNGVYPSSFFGS
jgi:hypothetical protein